MKRIGVIHGGCEEWNKSANVSTLMGIAQIKLDTISASIFFIEHGPRSFGEMYPFLFFLVKGLEPFRVCH
jgi:hypothetical protein